LRYPYRQVTILEEGDDADEFMGWASLNPKKYSVKRSFLSRLGKKLHFDARVRGGVRAPILSGEYDKVFPMDIYPEFLLKAAEAGDIDKMEQLGIYEVAPEDFALAEFVDTSKRPLQQIIRRALTDLHKELS
ncbi:MAG: NADH:ubiquinone reductase (Na(+)-transporting) subunit A, partial [Muribaculaceae bacterium]|nr:NADH:ubiquinone reductase (Na(+)-transporting) subunit A [Muribaculaceae bacterium]